MRQLSFLDCIELAGETCKPYNGTKKYVSTGAVDVDHISDEDTEMFSYADKPSRANLIAKPGDILFAKMMSTKKTLQIDDATSQYIYSTGFCAVRAKNGIITERCLYHLLTSKTFQDQKDKNCSGATQKAITNSGLSKIQIKLPPPAVQVMLASQLDLLNSIISLYQLQLVKLDELIKARFIEMFGDVLQNNMNWDESPLEIMAEITSGITKGRKTNEQSLKEVPYMAVSNVKAGYIDWTTVKTIMATESEITQYRLMPDDVLMTEGGDPDKLGRGALIGNPPKDCIHQNHIFRVRLNKNIVSPTYFSEYLKHQKAKRYFLGCAKQTTGIASINMKQLRALPVLLPPIELQTQFAAFVTQVEKPKAAVQSALDNAQLLFDSLMQKYFG